MFLDLLVSFSYFFFFNDTATTEIYTLSLHDALPILPLQCVVAATTLNGLPVRAAGRSEEHTSELQSRQYLVCRLLLEKKKKNTHLSHQSPLKKYKTITPQLHKNQ